MDFSPPVRPRSRVSLSQKPSFMSNKAVAIAFAISAFSFSFANTASAQTAPGTRAAGMGGAFVAVADDASAVYWNPAGLATGAVFNVQVDFGSADLTPGEPGDPGVLGGGSSTRLIALGVPPLGLSYYRLNNLHVAAPSPAVGDEDGREDQRIPAVRLSTSNFGVTFLHSLWSGVVVGTTLKLVRGSVAAGVVSAGEWGDVLDRVDDLEADGRTRADLDAGLMVTAGRVRLGLVARNLREPSFAPDDADEDSARLEREVRVGAAWGNGWPGLSQLVLSLDADLTRVSDFDGERRDVAAGAETWWFGRRLGVRGGWRASTVGEARPVGSAGISIAARPGVFIDGHFSGDRNDRRAWSLGARFTY
jgi:hypothetical protein